MRSNTAANIQRDGNTPMNRRTFRSSNRDIVKVSTGSVEEPPRAPRIEIAGRGLCLEAKCQAILINAVCMRAAA